MLFWQFLIICESLVDFYKKRFVPFATGFLIDFGLNKNFVLKHQGLHDVMKVTSDLQVEVCLQSIQN